MNSMHQRMATIKNFALYYGFEELEALAGFDLVILEPAAYSEADIRRIREGGAMTCGYLSVLETDNSFDFCHVESGDYLVVKGERRMNLAYSNWIMDPRSQHWAQIVLEMAERRVLAKGYDGVFLDTIADVEDPTLPKALVAQLVPATAFLIRRIRERFPRALLIQNSGINLLHRFTAPYLDGICWENFPLKWPEDYWSLNKLNELERLSRKIGLRVLLLAQMEDPTPSGVLLESLNGLQVRASQHGFLFYAAPEGYTRSVNTLFRFGPAH